MNLIEIENDAMFKDLMLEENMIVMIYKQECPFCEKAHPWMREFSENNYNNKLAQVDKDNIPKLLDLFNLQMYPTFIYVKEGKVEDMFFGDTQYDKVKEFIEKNN